MTDQETKVAEELNEDAVIERINEIMADSGDTKDVEAYLRTIYNVDSEGAIEVSEKIKEVLVELSNKFELQEV